ncbi:hypothetical protein EA772_03475 [Pedobacter sp. G11]|uniref:hypothetical protein n=1 Tax=Pedobacter sp. G11 TaxID=2482728 RepID=UPI000F5F8665|nr:hypothetical protein [Pedobacter sp. G11]AZI24455.1 hypothetical protein EA772_03475 [Pedobacter sp. G11]
MKRYLFSICTLIIVISACNPSAEKQQNSIYSKDGLSFSLPKYWKVKKDRTIDGVANSRFISISDEEPFSKDAYLIITSMDSVNLDKTLKNLITQSRASYGKRNVEFGMLNEPKTVKIGKYDVLKADFETRIIANRNKGSLAVMHHKGKTYSFISSVDIKDKKKNFSVADSVIKSLRVK